MENKYLLSVNKAMKISFEVLGLDKVAEIGNNEPTLALSIGEIQRKTAIAEHLELIKQGWLSPEQVVELKLDIEALNELLRRYGMGQGEIDSETEDIKQQLKAKYLPEKKE